MIRKTETLAKICLFRSLSPENIQLLDTQCSWHRAARNQWIIDYQDPSNDVFFVVSGTLREINAGEFFGEIAAIDNKPRSSGILAITEVGYARMPASVFRTAIHTYPDVCDQLLELLAFYVRSMSNRVNEFTTLDARHRIYAELLRLSRPDAARPAQALVSPPPAHADLAARVSIRRE